MTPNFLKKLALSCALTFAFMSTAVANGSPQEGATMVTATTECNQMLGRCTTTTIYWGLQRRSVVGTNGDGDNSTAHYPSRAR